MSIILLPKKVLFQVKNPVLVSNMLELKAIEKYRVKHPEMSMNAAAIQWIKDHAAAWRSKHPLIRVT